MRAVAASRLASARFRRDELVVAIPHGMKVKDLRTINAALYRRGVAWMPVTYDESTTSIGPAVIPGRAPCYECLLLRDYERHNGEGDTDPDSASRRVNPRYPSRDLYPQLSSRCLQAAALLMGRPLPKRPYAMQYIGRAPDWRPTEAPLVPHPLCTTCAGRQNKHRLVLRSRPRNYSNGGFRSIAAEQTLKRCRYLIGELGPILQLSDESFCGLSVYGSVGAFPTNILKRTQNPYLLRYTGKGCSEVQSVISSIAEAIERTCACFNESMVDCTGTRNQLGEMAIDIRELAFNIADINKNYNDKLLNWTRARSLTEGGAVLIPTEFVSLPSYPIGGAASLISQHTTNGFAAGNNLEEAVLQALLEVIERHNVWLAQRVDGLVKGICLSEVKPAPLRNIIRAAQAEGMETSLYLISTDLAIPTVTALLRGRKEGLPAYSAGFGCHLDPGIAVQRALTEAVQMLSMQMDIIKNDKDTFERIMSFQGRIDDLPEDDVFYYSLGPSIGRAFYRTYLDCGEYTDLRRARRCLSPDIRENIRSIVNYLSDEGCKVYAVDRSVRNYYFRVAKVIVTTVQPPSNVVVSKRLNKYQPLAPSLVGGNGR